MANLTKKQYEELTPYKDQLRAAYKNSYVHMGGNEFLKVAEIYKEVFENPLSKSQMSCNTCRLNALRKLGELYENYTAEQEKKKAEKKARTKKLDNVEEK